jgi:hypothetical protein
MEHAGCDVIYVDRSVSRDRRVRNSDKDAAQQEDAHVAENLRLLLDIFDEGMLPRRPSRSLEEYCTDGRIQYTCVAPVSRA